jgi:SPP1 family predicted phage head-tail adaptor
MQNNIIRLNKRVIIQAPKTSSDGMGGFEIEWTSHLTCYAVVEPILNHRTVGGELFSAMQIMNKEYLLFTVRYDASISHKMRIIYRNTPFNIERVTNQKEQDKWLQIIARRELG